MSAANRAFNVPHLIDLLVVNLAIPDVLRLQRANRLCWERASRKIWRAFSYHRYHDHLDKERPDGNAAHYLSCIEHLGVDHDFCRQCEDDMAETMTIVPRTPEQCLEAMKQCEALRRIELGQDAWASPAVAHGRKPIVQVRDQALLGLDGLTTSRGELEAFASWKEHFDVQQTLALTDEFARYEHVEPEHMGEMGAQSMYETLQSATDRSRQLAALYDPAKMDKRVTELSLVYSPIDLYRLGHMLGRRREVGAQPIHSVFIDQIAVLDLPAVSSFLEQAGGDLKILGLGRSGCLAGGIAGTPAIAFCDLPDLLDVLADHAPVLEQLSLAIAFDGHRDSNSLRPALSSGASHSHIPSLRVLHLTINSPSPREHTLSRAEALPAMDLARLLVARTASHFRVSLRQQLQYDDYGASHRDLSVAGVANRDLASTGDFMRYLQGLTASQRAAFHRYMQSYDKPAPADTPGMIALHMESIQQQPDQPTIQDIFHAYAAVWMAMRKLDKLSERANTLQGGTENWAALARYGAGPGGMIGSGTSGMDLVLGEILELTIGSLRSAELVAAEGRLEGMMRRYC